MKRRIPITLLIVLVILAAQAAFLVYMRATSPAAMTNETTPAKAGAAARFEIVELSGDAFIVSPLGERAAAAGDRLSPGESIRTDREARVLASLPLAAEIRLGPQSQVLYLPQADGRTTLQLESGSAYCSLLPRPPESPAGVRVVTPNAVLESKDTQTVEFLATVEALPARR